MDFFDKLEQQASKSQYIPPKKTTKNISESKSVALNKSFESKIKFFNQ